MPLYFGFVYTKKKKKDSKWLFSNYKEEEKELSFVHGVLNVILVLSNITKFNKWEPRMPEELAQKTLFFIDKDVHFIK